MNKTTASLLAVALTALSGLANAATGSTAPNATLSAGEGGTIDLSKCTLSGNGIWNCIECHQVGNITFCIPNVIVMAPSYEP